MIRSRSIAERGNSDEQCEKNRGVHVLVPDFYCEFRVIDLEMLDFVVDFLLLI